MQASERSGGLLARNLACQRGEKRLFRRLDLALEPGEAVHLIGPNGVGKSSLIQILAGLRASTRAPGEPRAQIAWRGAIGLVDERSALDPDRPLGQALEFWERIDGCTSPRAAIEAIGVGPLLDVPVRFLSTGQRKRAAFAALLNRAVPNWLLDEPLNGLDAEAREKLEALIALHCGGGGTVVVASHQPIALPKARAIDIRDFSWREDAQ